MTTTFAIVTTNKFEWARCGGVYPILKTGLGDVVKFQFDVGPRWLMPNEYTLVPHSAIVGKCINNQDYESELTLNRLYVLVRSSPILYNFIDDTGAMRGCRSHRFTLVQSGLPLPANKESTPMDRNTYLKLTIETDHKIYAIKTVRTLTGSGLKEAKDMVENGMIFHSNMANLIALVSNFPRVWNDNSGHLPLPKLVVTGYDKPVPVVEPVDMNNYFIPSSF